MVGLFLHRLVVEELESLFLVGREDEVGLLMLARLVMGSAHRARSALVELDLLALAGLVWRLTLILLAQEHAHVLEIILS